MSEDPNIWSNPDKFDADQFIIGEEEADLTAVAGVKMMPFESTVGSARGLGWRSYTWS